eukprot:5576877-Alexandrium_andersonii.AAC.1
MCEEHARIGVALSTARPHPSQTCDPRTLTAYDACLRTRDQATGCDRALADLPRSIPQHGARDLLPLLL